MASDTIGDLVLRCYRKKLVAELSALVEQLEASAERGLELIAVVDAIDAELDRRLLRRLLAAPAGP
jgi:formate-dependent phosphoribosylglycinamide formyltransferase (GAR transformylase)